jgi:hypothetical protein
MKRLLLERDLVSLVHWAVVIALFAAIACRVDAEAHHAITSVIAGLCTR